MSSGSPIERLAAYVDASRLHAAKYSIADIPADRLTHLIYAFAKVSESAECISADTADDSVNFPQLIALKQAHPNVATLIAIGGPAHSGHFAHAAANQQTRRNFVASCIHFMQRHAFDGIEIDWNDLREEEAEKFIQLLAELRARIDAIGAEQNRHYLLTVAVPAEPEQRAHLDLARIHPCVDWINLLAFGFTPVTRDTTDLAAPLMAYDVTSFPDHANANVDAVVQAVLHARVSADKVVLGVDFIGTGWAGVPNINNGLYQHDTGRARGTWDAAGAPPSGQLAFADLKQNYIGSSQRFWHPAAQVPWLYQPAAGGAPGLMISYEDPQSLAAKAAYVQSGSLGGMVIAGLEADDDQQSLVAAIADALGIGETATGGGTYLATGTVTQPDGTPARGLAVAAFAQSMRKRTLLGRTRTGADGVYHISYAAPTAQSGSGPGLVIEVYGQNQEVLATSAVVFDAARIETVDIELTQSGSEVEYDRIVRLLTPLVAGQDVTLATLEENSQYHDLTFAAGETGVALGDLNAFAVAQRLASQSQLPAQFWFAVLATNTISLPALPPATTSIEALAAAALAAVPQTPDTAVQAGLAKAGAANATTAPSADQLQAWLTQYRALMATEAVKPGAAGIAGTILDASGVPQAKRDALLTAYLAGGNRNDIIARLMSGNQFTSAELDAIGAALTVRDLTFGDASLVTHFAKTITTGAAASSLAAMSAADWQTALSQAGTVAPDFVAGATPAAQLTNYATLLAKRAALSYPTAAFAGDLSRALAQPGGSAFQSGTTMLAFLQAHPEFELATTSVDGFLANNANPNFFNTAAASAQFTQDLKAAQRVFKVAPSFAATNHLVRDGLHSAMQIYKLGKTQMVRKYGSQPGFTAASAGDTYERAASTHAATLTVVGHLRSTQSANRFQALSNPQSTLDNFPDLQNLFGNVQSCDCDDCQSIFSPAAYLTDLLHYLEGRLVDVNNPAAGTVKDIVNSRRPDIGYIELSCNNAETPLLYIDLACEVMEDRVAPWVLFTLPAAQQANLVQGAPGAALVAAFAAGGTTLSTSARVSAKDEFGNWVIHDTAQTYLVQGGSLNVSILRQTHLTEDELSAYPEYVNPNAYATLSTANFPQVLPFDLYTEEVRAYLANMNVPRTTLMETFAGPNAPNNPQPLDIAAEYMQIASYEQTLIFNADPNNQFKYWGTPNNAAALANMSTVSTFLATTGILYTDLLKFLTLAFVNPNGTIVIQNPAGDCDLTQMTLQPLDTNALDRFHRFLRLWRKLGWQMWEVDLVINHPALGNGTLDSSFALALYPFLRIKDKLGSFSVEQLGAFWGNINTTAKFTAAYQPPDPSLYETLFLNKKLTNPLDPNFAISAVTAAVPTVMLTDDFQPILAAAKIKQTDLAILIGLTAPANGPPFIANPNLTLANLSFIYRHSVLAKALGIKIADWATLLYLLQQDVFHDTATTWAFLKLWDRIKASGFSIDQLDYIVSADPTAKSAVADKSITTVLAALQKSLQAIAAAANPANIPTVADGLTAAILAQLQTLGWDAVSATAAVGVLNGQIQQQRLVQGMPANFTFPAAITAAAPTGAGISIGYDTTAGAIRLTGVLTSAQQTQLLNDPSLAAVTGIASYQAAINDMAAMAGLLIKYYDPFFTAPLATLPSTVQLGSLASPLSAKVAYDTDLDQLTFMGIMSTDEQAALNNLSADANYRAAVLSLFNQPRSPTPPPPSEQWLTLAALTMPVDDPTNPPPNPPSATIQANILANLTLAELGSATVFGLNAYVVRKLSTDQVMQQLAAGLGLTQAIVSYLVTQFAIFGTAPPHALLGDFLDPSFVNASSAVTANGFPEIFQGYRWLSRVALITKTLAMGFADLQWTVDDQAQTGVLDITTLPLADSATLIPPPLGGLIDLTDIMRYHHSASTTDLTLLDIIDDLINPPSGGYSSQQFADDLVTLTDWTASDVVWMAAAGNVAQAFPGAYETAAGWNWIFEAELLMLQLGATAQAAASWTAPKLASADSASLKQTLRGQFDEATFLTLNKPIEDGLRQRKRDSLVAWLLAQPMPADNPTGKWTDPDDLFAYYLIDVEMCSCQPSSRIVQASASVQLFVQRAFMGLEPKVQVSVDADSGWNDWSWMNEYRVWEANRMVFAYPENYCEPDLRKDKSDLFSALENELQQNQVTKDTVETAFEHYLDGLDNVSKLEVSGMFYQEFNQTLHVFANTSANPPIFYYRPFIQGQRWTAWSQVGCDIKANYVVPLVNNERLYIVWPEVQSSANPPTSVNIPSQSDQTQGSMNVDPPAKDRNMNIAISEFKSGQWQPKKVSTDQVWLGAWTDEDFNPGDFFILPLDLTWIPNAVFPPPAKPPATIGPGLQWILDGTFLLQVCRWTPSAMGVETISPPFELAGCKGYPAEFDGTLNFYPLVQDFYEDYLYYGHNIEYEAGGTLTPASQNQPVSSLEILGNTPTAFEVCCPHSLSFFDKLFFLSGLGEGISRWAGTPQYVTMGTFYDWFYGDKLRCFLVRPELYPTRLYRGLTPASGNCVSTLYYEDLLNLMQQLSTLIAQKKWAEFFQTLLAFFAADYQFRWHFFTFFHPLVCLFAKNLYQKDVEGLMARATQFADRGLDFAGTYQPTAIVDPGYPKETVHFAWKESYAIYNWELFYFAPIYVAELLTTNQQYDEALRWFHFVFDPTGADGTDPRTGNPAPAPQKYWITKPFFLRQDGGPNGYLAESLDQLMNMLASDPNNPTPNCAIQELQEQVAQWRQNPFDPHIIAMYRTVAYQKFAFMKYCDCLLAAGDSYFSQDTIETINIATQYYVCVAELLGTQPQDVPPPAEPLPLTFNELDPQLDAFSNALVSFENLIPAMPVGPSNGPPPPPLPSILYFCIPQNAQLMSYWGTVEDRLYKIRNCLNLQGVFSPAALFAPPINPMALVEATAAGEDISSALADLDAPLPYYRFATMLQKANEFNNDVKALGAALLAALEKNDAEGLALLRQTQEIALLQAVRAVKQRQIDDAQAGVDGLTKNQELVTIRLDYYASRPFMNPGETTAASLTGTGLTAHAGAIIADVLAGVMFLIPNFHVGAAGFGGSPQIHVSEGGTNTGKSGERGANGLYQAAQALDWGGRIAATVAGYQRRMDDWQNQIAMASKELEQIAKQLNGANARLDIANKDLANQDLQISNSQAVSQFMLSKYTDQELYQWMIGRISQTYFQAYQLAYNLAKQAERCYRFEIGLDDSNIIQFGYWDSLRKGLHAGELLGLGLRNLENAYLGQNKREFECTKNVSLALYCPLALVALRDAGICAFTLPEELFDLDYQGHYFRRIKSMSLTIPCVAGPNTTVSATLRLMNNMIRINSSTSPQYVHNQDDSGAFTDDVRFRQSGIRINAIAASSAQNDSGMFELNFRDERYLPFEGAGAISTWQLELTQDPQLRQFSYDTISDVILHVRYTSREDVGQFRTAAVAHLKQDVLGNISPQLPLYRLFDVMHEFPTEWYAFLHPPTGQPETCTLPIKTHHFPFIAQNRAIQVQGFSLVVRTIPSITSALAGTVDPGTSGANVFTMHFPPPDKNGFSTAQQDGGLAIGFVPTQPWVIQLGTKPNQFNTLSEGDVLDCYLLVEYTLS